VSKRLCPELNFFVPDILYLEVMSPVYLLEHSPYKPPEEYRVNVVEVQEAAKKLPNYNETMRDFMERVFAKSGISPTGSFLPPWIHPACTSDPKVSFVLGQMHAVSKDGRKHSPYFTRRGT